MVISPPYSTGLVCHQGLGTFASSDQPSAFTFRKEKRRNLDPKSVPCILIGYEENSGSKVYRLYDPKKKCSIQSCDVIVDETSSVMQQKEPGGGTMRIAWEPEQEHPSPNISTDHHDQYLALDPIASPTRQDTILANPDIRDTIVVQPRLAPLSSPLTQDNGERRGVEPEPEMR